jgi:hypothetical protein
MKATTEYAAPVQLRDLDQERESTTELLRLGLTPVEVLKVDTSWTVNDVWENDLLEYMRHLPTIVMKSRNATLVVIVYHLVDPGLLLRDRQAPAKIGGLGNGYREKGAQLLHKRVISTLKRIE